MCLCSEVYPLIFLPLLQKASPIAAISLSLRINSHGKYLSKKEAYTDVQLTYHRPTQTSPAQLN